MVNYSASFINKVNPSFRDLFGFLYDLTALDLDLFVVLIKSVYPMTLEELSNEVSRDKSTVFRSLQRLLAAGICTKESRNLREGGYYHVYKSVELETLRKGAWQKLEQVKESVAIALKNFDDETQQFVQSRGMRILVADDERDMTNSYKLALGQRGHKVVITTNGEECLAAYKSAPNEVSKGSGLQTKRPFDAVILDYKMPKLNGIDVAKEILSLVPEQRIIFASAFVRDTLAESIKQLGQVVELMQKPFDAKALVETVEDRGIQDGLKRLMSGIDQLENLEGKQLTELFGALRLIQKARTF